MHVRGNQRAGLLAKYLFGLTVVVGLGTFAYLTNAVDDEPATAPGSQVMPGAAAKGTGASRRPVSPAN